MKFQIRKDNGLSIKADALVLSLAENSPPLTGVLNQVDIACDHAISSLIDKKVLTGKLGDVEVFRGVRGLNTQTVFVVGIGSQESLSYNSFRQAAGNLIRAAEMECCESIVWGLTPSDYDGDRQVKLGSAITEGCLLGSYKIKTFKSDAKPNCLKTIQLAVENEDIFDSFQKSSEQGQVIAESINLARDLANTPANILTPDEIVKNTSSWFPSDSGISVKVIDVKEAQKLGMGAFLGVAQGSIHPGSILVLTYKGTSKEAPLCLVGKGITFDTGGISIKPSKGMSEMKADMSGAAAVLGTMKAISQLKPSANVTAIVPLAENSPSHCAQRPGDVVTAMNNKTIEILNTDAEGRLILCDAISYAVKTIKPAQIIDIATLTGACLVALGTAATAILSNSDSMVSQMKDIAETTGERVWQLPLYEDYLEQLSSDVADLSNCYEGREAGTCTAAKFLEQFVEDTPWLHMDMASVMSYSKPKGTQVKGMSAEGTRNLIEYVLRYQ